MIINREHQDKLIASVVTFIVTALLFVIVFVVTLRYIAPGEQVWPPSDTSELLLDGEYVMLGDIAVPDAGVDMPAPQAEAESDMPQSDDMVNAGEPAPVTTPLVSSQNESPMKVKPKPEAEKTGPTAAELEQQRKEKQQQETAEKINKKVSFGSSANSGGAGQGKSGSPNGNASMGALSGTPGHSLSGRSLAHWDKPKGVTVAGTIVVKVRVNRAGKVIDASYSGGTGAVASSSSARNSCVQAARASSFSVDNDAPAEQVGTITYRFN